MCGLFAEKNTGLIGPFLIVQKKSVKEIWGGGGGRGGQHLNGTI